MRLQWALVMLAAVCLVAAAVAIAYAAGKATSEVPEVIRARGFEVVDDDGRLVVSLVITANDTGHLRFYDRDGGERISMGLFANGAPFLILQGRFGSLHAAHLRVGHAEDEDDNVQLFLRNDRLGIASLRCDDQGLTELLLANVGEGSEASLRTHEDGYSGLDLGGPKTCAHAELALTSDGDPELRLVDKEGTLLRSAP